jgi:hypothetical protein
MKGALSMKTLILSVFEFLYEMFFGCRHERLTRPFTLQRDTYKVCLDCGKHVMYSAERMEPLTAREIRRARKIDEGEIKILPQPARRPQLVPSADTETDAVA